MNGKTVSGIAIIAGAVLILLLILLLCAPVLAELRTLGSYRIRISSMVSPANAQNAVLAGSLLNGHVIEPDEIFSYNETVGERTAEKGFIPGYISTTASQPIKSVGGGVCTTASILHQAVKASGLKVIERHNHVAPTSYLPQGEDAAIWYGIEDYKFQNTLQNPVMIHAGVEEECLQIFIMEVLPEEPAKEQRLQETDSSVSDTLLQSAGEEQKEKEELTEIFPDAEICSEEAPGTLERNNSPPEIERLHELVYTVPLNVLQLGSISGQLPHHYSVLSIIGQGILLSTPAE